MQSAKSVGVLKVLSISPLEDDHLSLESIISHSTWMLLKANRLPAALALFQKHDISVVLCERDLRPGSWIDLLEGIRDLPHPPSLIVTSGMADERLWAEVLNRGAWDVLAKPFDHMEVVRSVKSAWQHWYNQIRQTVTVMSAAS
jgi:DNA-binding NtrC family response regulator